MADRNRTRRTYSDRGQVYIYGNTVRQAEVMPRRQEEIIDPEQPKRVSRQVRQNRRNAKRMSAGYVVFLAVMASLALLVCVQYLQLQARLTTQSKEITSMQKELAQMREANTTKYNNLLDSVNMDDVRKRAEELGMVHAEADQIVEYENPANDYVKQYEDIPEDGVLASSGGTGK